MPGRRARRHPRADRKCGHRRQEARPLLAHQRAIGRRIALESRQRYLFLARGHVAIGKIGHQHYDRVATGDNVVVHEAKEERALAVAYREETERVDGTAHGKRPVDQRFDLDGSAFERRVAAVLHRHDDPRGTAGPLEAPGTSVERIPGEAHRLERPADARLEPRRVERHRDADHVRGTVGMELPPSQHRALEEIETPFHQREARLVAVRTSAFAPSHQWRFTLYQRSAACSRLVTSTPFGISGAAPGRQASTQRRVTGCSARCEVAGRPI